MYRIFRVDRKFVIVSWTIGAVLTVWTTITLLLCIFACRPVKAAFNIMLLLSKTTYCPIKSPDVLNIHGFCNIITDFALVILPVPMVWKLHVTTRKKLGLAVVFATGLLYARLPSAP